MNASSAALWVGFLLCLFFWLLTICLAAAIKQWWFWALVLYPLCNLVLMALFGKIWSNSLLFTLLLTVGFLPNLLFGLFGLKRADRRFNTSYPG